MANFSKFLSLISGADRTVDLSNNSNILELGGGGLQMDGSTSGHVVISASATTATYSFTWPAAQAAGSGYTLSNDGTGLLTWVPASSGSVTAISVNTANGFAGTSSGGSTPALTLTTTITGILQGNGTAISAATTTGSGTVVLATSPTLVTPALGTPSAVVLTNGTSLPLTTGVTGILPIANGGTNAASAASAFNNLAPTTATGGLIVGTGASTYGNLAIGTTGQVLTVAAGTASWATIVGFANTALSNLATTALNVNLNLNTNALTDTSGALAFSPYVSLNGVSGTFSGTNPTPGSSPGEIDIVAGPSASVYLQADAGANTTATPSAYGNNYAEMGVESPGDAFMDGALGNTVAVFNATSGVSWDSGAAGGIFIQSVPSTTSSAVGDIILDASGTGFAGHTGVTGRVIMRSPFIMVSSTVPTDQLTFKVPNAITSYSLTWPSAQASGTQVLQNNGSGTLSWASAATGSVTSVSVVSTNGFAGTVATATSTPAITIETTLTTPVLAGNGTALIAATTTGTGSTVVLNAGPTITGTLTTSAISAGAALNMNSNQINNVANGTASGDAVNLSQLQAAISGLTWKGPVAAYANSNVPLTGSTPLVIDGYTVLNGDLLLLANQTTASQNGEYSAAITGGSYVLTANGQPTAAGDAWLVLNGTVFGDSAFVANAAVPLATFTEFAGPTAYVFTAPLVLTGRTVSITQSTTSTDGYLSSTDWNTFNNKQPAGAYITALTGDGTATGPGSSVFTLASVATAGTTGSSTSIPSITINAKGLVTSVTGNAVVAPAGTLSGTTLNSTVVTSSLTTVGTIGTGVWNGTAIGPTFGGTGQTSYATGDTLYASATNVLSKLTIGSTGQVLTVAGGVPAWSTASVASAPAITTSEVSGQALTASTLYALRYELSTDSGTVGQMWKADNNAATTDNFYAIGLAFPSGSVSIGGAVTVVEFGLINVPSHGFTTGAPLYLGSSGACTSTAPSSAGLAVVRVGQVKDANNIWVDVQVVGVN